jgi:hypothetical protein
MLKQLPLQSRCFKVTAACRLFLLHRGCFHQLLLFSRSLSKAIAAQWPRPHPPSPKVDPSVKFHGSGKKIMIGKIGYYSELVSHFRVAYFISAKNRLYPLDLTDGVPHFVWWKTIILVLSFGSFAYGAYLIATTYIEDFSTSKINKIRTPVIVVFSEVESPFVYIEGSLEGEEGIHVDSQILASFTGNVTKDSIDQIDRITLTILDKMHSPLNQKSAAQLLQFYSDQTIVLKPTKENSTIFNGEENIEFEQEGDVGIMVLAIGKDDKINAFYFLPDQITVKPSSDLLQIQAAKETIYNGARIEGLTVVGIGFALMMFLLEVGIRDE